WRRRWRTSHSVRQSAGAAPSSKSYPSRHSSTPRQRPCSLESTDQRCHHFSFEVRTSTSKDHALLRLSIKKVKGVHDPLYAYQRVLPADGVRKTPEDLFSGLPRWTHFRNCGENAVSPLLAFLEALNSSSETATRYCCPSGAAALTPPICPIASAVLV